MGLIYGSLLRGEILNIQRRCSLCTGAANARVFTVPKKRWHQKLQAAIGLKLFFWQYHLKKKKGFHLMFYHETTFKIIYFVLLGIASKIRTFFRNAIKKLIHDLYYCSIHTLLENK